MQADSVNTGLDGAEDEAALQAGLSDILAQGLAVVFCGLNPALTAALDGHNFSNANNRFWRVLHLAGFTPRLLRADEERELLQYGCGVTAAVSRPTRRASELNLQDYISAVPVLENKIRTLAPANLAFLGKAAYAAITRRTDIEWGRQPDQFAGATVWLLPNPSGLNRAFNLEKLTGHYLALRKSL